MSIQFKGQRIEGADVVAVQVGVWNEGKKSIRVGDILKQVEIAFSPAVRILQASVSKRSRDVTGLAIADAKEGERSEHVRLTWTILERGDGGVIQIVYAGPESATVELHGVIEGQHSARNLRTRLQVHSPIEQYQRSKTRGFRFFIFTLVATVGVGALIIYQMMSVSRLRGMPSFMKVVLWSAPLLFVAYVWLTLDAYWSWRDAAPPFGF
jgi:hypothetical protein